MCTGVHNIFMYIFTHAQTQPKNTSVECTKFSREFGTTETFLQMNLKKNGCQIMQTKAKNNIYNIKFFELTELLAWTCRRNLKTEI